MAFRRKFQRLTGVERATLQLVTRSLQRVSTHVVLHAYASVARSIAPPCALWSALGL
jgi:hypothetical protein